MYQCICDTCEAHRLIEELEQAQEYFNEHAERGCEVEIINVELAVDQLNTEPTQTAAFIDELKTTDDTCSKDEQQ